MISRFYWLYFPVLIMGFSLILIEVKLLQEETLSLNIFYLLECAKRIRHKLNILMKSSPIYNKLQHYLTEHACI
jgi:hypothetical protein